MFAINSLETAANMRKRVHDYNDCVDLFWLRQVARQ